MGDDFYLASGVSEKLIGFRSSFLGAGFQSTGSFRDEVSGDGGQHSVDEFGLFAGTLGAGVDGLGPVAQGVEAALEADAFQRDVVKVGRLLHEYAHEVVGDQMDLELLLDHRRALAAQDIDFQRGLDLGEVEFDVPALGVEFADGVGGVKHGIGERGGNEDGAGAKALGGDHRADQAHGQLLGQMRELILAPHFGALLGFGPNHEPISDPHTATETQVAFAQLVQSHHCIDAAVMQSGHRPVGAKGTIGEDDIALFQLGPKLAEELAIMGVMVAGGVFQQRAAGQGKESCHLQHREPTTRFLSVGLRPHRLVLRRVGHGDAGAVDDLHLAPGQPPFALEDVAFHRPSHLSRDELQGVEGQPLPRLAIGARRDRLGRTPIAPTPPRLHPPRHFPARTPRAQRLRHERPKGHRRRQAPQAAVDSLGRRLEQMHLKQMAEDRVKILQAFEFGHGFQRRGLSTSK